uniref:HNH nuclease domain-containing protein n=1 Tax=Entomoneis paludosa TaxID=265537 RepID=A0A6U3ASU7_9STRA
MKITVCERKLLLAGQEDLDKFLKTEGRISVVDSEGYEIINFTVLVDGGTYTLGPLIQQQGSEPTPPLTDDQLRLQIQQLKLLKLVAEEVNKTRKSRLNCWERESARTTGSNRSPQFRQKVIRHYQRKSSSGKSVKCQVLEEWTTLAAAEESIIAAHIWKASTRGKDLQEFGLSETDVDNPRNGLFLTKGIEDAFENQQVCFLYNTIKRQLILWVADSTILSKTIEGSNPSMKFSDIHQRPLICPRNSLPFRRLLSWHARLTLELRKENVQVADYTSEYDLSPGRNHKSLDPISQAIDEMVEPGEDASVSGE